MHTYIFKTSKNTKNNLPLIGLKQQEIRGAPTALMLVKINFNANI